MVDYDIDMSLRAAAKHLWAAMKQLDEMGIAEHLDDDIYDAHAIICYQLAQQAKASEES